MKLLSPGRAANAGRQNCTEVSKNVIAVTVREKKKIHLRDVLKFPCHCVSHYYSADRGITWRN
jgi:hypothetical protein